MRSPGNKKLGALKKVTKVNIKLLKKVGSQT